MTTGAQREIRRTVALIPLAAVVLALLLAPLVPVSAMAARAARPAGAGHIPSAFADRSADFTWSPAPDGDPNGDSYVSDYDDDLDEKPLAGGVDHTYDHLVGLALATTPALSAVLVPYPSAVRRE